jgi:hypothetical protein
LPWDLSLLERFESRWDWSQLSGSSISQLNLQQLERFENLWDWENFSSQILTWSQLRESDVEILLKRIM